MRPSDLYQHYLSYNNDDKRGITTKKFSTILIKMGITKCKSNGKRYYVGLKPKAIVINTTKFIENESYEHKRAKELLRDWLINIKYSNDHIQPAPLTWDNAKSKRVFLEYPIVTNKINSVKSVWNQIGFGYRGHDFVPSFNDLKKCNLYPIAIVDVVIEQEGHPIYFIEVVHTNPVSKEKKQKLLRAGVSNLYEISASWILSQKERPTELVLKKII
jgi:hypothetical protein